MPKKPLNKMSLDELASHSSNAQEGSIAWPSYRAEFMRRQTKAQMEAARYMLWTVIAISVTSAANCLFLYLGWAYPPSR